MKSVWTRSLPLKDSLTLSSTETAGVAPAKINLALHVGGRREDGLHRLASLVAFTEFGDGVGLANAAGVSLEVRGPFGADVPHDDSNLVLRAARMMAGRRGAAISLEKRIPVAAGLGGGSSDAAEVLRQLSLFWNAPLPPEISLMELGADVPACLAGCPAVVEGAGEVVSPVDWVPELQLLLVNPGIPISTKSVFRAFRGSGTPMLEPPGCCRGASEFIAWLAAQRNDLEAVAIGLEPEVDRLLGRIRRLPGCLLSRMSGSGATCFGIFSEMAEAAEAARTLKSECPSWWIAATSTRHPSASGVS